MEFGVCKFLSLRDFYMLRATCRRYTELPAVFDHLVPSWCPRQDWLKFALLHAGQGRKLINIPHEEYNLCTVLSCGALFASTRHTISPLFVAPDLRMVNYYLGIFDIITMCALSDDRVAVSTAHSSRVYDNMTFTSQMFTPYRYSKLLSVPKKRIAYGVTTNEYPKRIMRIYEADQAATTEPLITMRNPVIAVTDNFCVYADCMAPCAMIYAVSHDDTPILHCQLFAKMPTMVLQIVGMPNNKVVVKCTNRLVYVLGEPTSLPVRVYGGFDVGVGEMRAIGDVIYCSDRCLCTTTHRVYRSCSRFRDNILGVCNREIVAVARSRSLLV